MRARKSEREREGFQGLEEQETRNPEDIRTQRKRGW